MDSTEKILAVMQKEGTALSAGKIAELSGLDRKEVDKAMKKLKTTGLIVSPKNCYWEPKK
jgi:biotin operon repressor